MNIKRFFLPALAALMAFSCQKYDSSMGDAFVTFVVETPEIAVKSFGDGTSANDLYYGIYDEDGNLISEISKVDEASKESINIKTTISTRLVTGNVYSMIFWADNISDVCDVDFAAKTMKYSPKTSNLEAYDAFWTYLEPFTVTGDMTKEVKLYRPFAQLNIGTDDLDAAQAAGVTIVSTKIAAKSPQMMNLVDGTVSQEVEVTYDSNLLPDNETFPVTGYEYLAMNYILVGKEKVTGDITFAYSDNKKDYSRVFTFVPLQRNYRTNIYGSLLTNEISVNVTIEPAFEEPDYIVDGNQSQDFHVGGSGE